MKQNQINITVQRPVRGLHFGPPNTNPRSPQEQPKNYSITNPQSPSNLITPRQPLVHVFVCDFGNAKVKALTDQFITTLCSNGINVYIEKYLTHQPGFQVRAASISSQADFFYQIHSKTAGSGDVRLYVNGQPKRMNISQAIGSVWSWWRLRSGCLTKEESNVLSREKILYLLRTYGDLDPANLDIEDLQKQAREAIDQGLNTISLINKIRSFDMQLNEAKNNILRYKNMSTEWPKEKGNVIARFPQTDTTRGLSQPLKDILLSIISQTLKKTASIATILGRYSVTEPQVSEDDQQEIQIETADKPTVGDGSSWKYMLESVDEDHPGSSMFMHIASFGEGTSQQQSIDRYQNFMLEDF
ncbi:hypothetical protein GPJ56_008248 [Histomonas meleagridis]|uniref:uncharacterized protein n=1 Tax=Histomonas meleagridis TaxID=135588 RepID=UPI00355987EE|nr:hypothetical protein GPJ56_008248 [Histomonas meleagridis]KAH0797270.1 hypothetical protein GO595_009952 [Histomonas meleagridis]